MGGRTMTANNTYNRVILAMLALFDIAILLIGITLG